MNRIKKNPSLIKDFKDPSEKIMLATVKQDGLLLRYIKKPTQKVIKAALFQNVDSLKYVDDPDYAILLFAAHVGALNTIRPLALLTQK